MVTLNIAVSSPINPPGAHPVLTPDQAWAGLARKARRPQDFVPIVDSCKIIQESETSIEAIVHFKPVAGHPLSIRETCTLREPCRLDYAMEDGSSASNIISTGPGDADGDMLLTFVFAWECSNARAGSEDLKRIAESRKKVIRKRTELLHPTLQYQLLGRGVIY